MPIPVGLTMNFLIFSIFLNWFILWDFMGFELYQFTGVIFASKILWLLVNLSHLKHAALVKRQNCHRIFCLEAFNAISWLVLKTLRFNSCFLWIFRIRCSAFLVNANVWKMLFLQDKLKNFFKKKTLHSQDKILVHGHELSEVVLRSNKNPFSFCCTFRGRNP